MEGVAIASSRQVCEMLHSEHDPIIGAKLVRRVLKEDLGLSFVKTKKVELTDSNIEKVVVLSEVCRV